MVSVKDIELDFGDLVVVTLDNGKVFKGIFAGFDPSDESPSGLDEVEVQGLVVCWSLQVDEIAELRKVA